MGCVTQSLCGLLVLVSQYFVWALLVSLVSIGFDSKGDFAPPTWCYKEQYCIETWNVKSMNQGKSEVVKQKTARANINILGISGQKWTGMGEFKSDNHYIYYCGQEPLRRNGVAFIVNKSLKCSTWVQSQKWQNDLCSFPKQNIQYHSNPSLCLTTNPKEAEVEQFYENLQDFLKSENHSAVSNSLWPQGLHSSWNSPGQNTGVGSLSLLQEIFPTQG